MATSKRLTGDDFEDENCETAYITKEDINLLLEETDFDEFDIREWFREFLKVTKYASFIFT